MSTATATILSPPALSLPPAPTPASNSSPAPSSSSHVHPSSSSRYPHVPDEQRQTRPRLLRRVRSKSDHNIEYALNDTTNASQRQAPPRRLPPSLPNDDDARRRKRYSVENSFLLNRAKRDSVTPSNPAQTRIQSPATLTATAARQGPDRAASPHKKSISTSNIPSVHTSRLQHQSSITSPSSIPSPRHQQVGSSGSALSPRKQTGGIPVLSHTRIVPAAAAHSRIPSSPKTATATATATAAAANSPKSPTTNNPPSRVAPPRSWRRSAGTADTSAFAIASPTATATATAAATPSAAQTQSRVKATPGKDSSKGSTTTTTTRNTERPASYLSSPRLTSTSSSSHEGKQKVEVDHHDQNPGSAPDLGQVRVPEPEPENEAKAEVKAKAEEKEKEEREEEEEEKEREGLEEKAEEKEEEKEEDTGKHPSQHRRSLTPTHSQPPVEDKHQPQPQLHNNDDFNNKHSLPAPSNPSTTRPSYSYLRQRRASNSSSLSQDQRRPATSPSGSSRISLQNVASKPFSSAFWSSSRRAEPTLPTIPSTLTEDTDSVSSPVKEKKEETSTKADEAIDPGPGLRSPERRRVSTRLTSFSRFKRQNKQQQGQKDDNSKDDRSDLGTVLSTPAVFIHASEPRDAPSLSVAAQSSAQPKMVDMDGAEGGMGESNDNVNGGIDTSSKESMTNGSGKSVKGEDVFLNIARSSSRRKTARSSLSAMPLNERRNSKLGFSSRLGSRIVSSDDAPKSPTFDQTRDDRQDQQQRGTRSRATRTPPSLHPLDEASRLRYFGRPPRSVTVNHSVSSPSAEQTRFPRSSTTGFGDTRRHSQTQQLPYVPNGGNKIGTGSNLSSSSGHNSRSWGSSCSTEKQSYGAQHTPRVPEEPEDTSSTVWNELDDLKSRIKRLEITGKIHPSATAANGTPTPRRDRKEDERPRTAATDKAPPSVPCSPRRPKSSGASAPADVDGRDNADGSTTPSNGGSMGLDPRQLHPLLHTSLEKAKPNLSSSVYRALETTAQDALLLAALLGSTATGSTGGNGASGSSSHAAFASAFAAAGGDRQARRKADSVCRGLTELCLALSDEMLMIHSSKMNGNAASTMNTPAQTSNAENFDSLDGDCSTPKLQPNGYFQQEGQAPSAYGGANLEPESAPVSQATKAHYRRSGGYFNEPTQDPANLTTIQGYPGYPVIPRIPSTTSRREKRNSALLGIPSNIGSTNVSPRNSLIFENASVVSAQPQQPQQPPPHVLGSPAMGAPAHAVSARSPNHQVPTEQSVSSPSRLSRLSSVLRTRRLQQQMGVDTSQMQTMNEQITQSPSVVQSAAPGPVSGVKPRAASRFSAVGDMSSHRLSMPPSFSDRRISREISYDLGSPMHQQHATEQYQTPARAANAAVSRVQSGSGASQFSFSSPLRSRTFGSPGSGGSGLGVNMGDEHTGPAAPKASTHVPLANLSNANVQPGFRRFGLGSMLGRKQQNGNPEGTNGVNAHSSATVIGVNDPGLGYRRSSTQPLGNRSRTRSLGTQNPDAAGGPAAGAQASYSSPDVARGSVVNGGQSAYPNGVSGIRRVSLRPRVRSTNSTEEGS